MKKVKGFVLALIMLFFSISSARAEEIGRKEFMDILFKIMGISEEVSRVVAGLSDEEIFAFETDYLLRNYDSRSLIGLSGKDSLTLDEFAEVIYAYFLTQDLELDKSASTFEEKLKALAELGIGFPGKNANAALDRDAVLKILNSPLFAELKAEAYHSPVDVREGPDEVDVPDTAGAEPDTPANYSTWGLEDNDYDDDGYPDDNDAFPEDASEWLDTDSDGIGNNADTDDDADGYTDADEAANATDPLDNTSTPPDNDNDHISDLNDPDDDNDNHPDISDAFPMDASEWLDTDSDGIGNNADTDDDNDGYPDVSDAFPLDAAEWLDTDNDGTGNNADTDDDDDGYPDVSDAFPEDSAEWVDTDNDGIGNNADTDDDDDGLSDILEVARGTYSLNADSDGDGRKDGEEESADADYGWPAALDADDDGISDKRAGWGWALSHGHGPQKEQLADLEEVKDSFGLYSDYGNWDSRAEKLVWDTVQGNGTNDIPAGLDRDQVRQMVKSELQKDITDIIDYNRFRKFDAVLTRIADAQTGKVLTDIYGNRVRVDQYILRPDSDTVQLLNITLRNNHASAPGSVNIDGASILEWKVDFNKPLDSLPSGSLKTLPWSSYLSSSPVYSTEPEYYPQTSAITLARSNSKAVESRTFESIAKSGMEWTQAITDTILALNVNRTDIGEYRYADMTRLHVSLSNGWLWRYIAGDSAEIAIGIYNIGEDGNILTIPDSGDNIFDMHASLGYSLNLEEGYAEWHCKFGNFPHLDNVDVITIPMSGFEWNDISYSE